MKKLALLLTVILIGTAAFAAAPVGKMGLGVQGLTLTSGAATQPTLQIHFTDAMAGEFGIGLANNGNTTQIVLSGAMKMKIADMAKDLRTHWGIGLAIQSNPNWNSGSSRIVLAGNIGAEYFMTPNFSIEGNLVPIVITSASPGSTTTFSILSAANAVPSAIVGCHFYL